MKLKQRFFSNNRLFKKKILHQGDCVHLVNDENLFQIIGIDNEHEKCWVRQWPLSDSGSPVFEIEINQISTN